METSTTRQFNLAQRGANAGARYALREAKQSAVEFLAPLARGDWGEVCKGDALENELSLEQTFRLRSAYRTRRGERLITEANRSATTLSLPEEY